MFVFLIISNVFSHCFPTQIGVFSKRLYGFSQFYVIILLRFSKLRAGFGKCLRWVFRRSRRKSVDCLAAWLAAWLLEFCHVFVWLLHFKSVFTWLSDANLCFSQAVYLIFRRKMAALAGWLAGKRFSHSFPR